MRTRWADITVVSLAICGLSACAIGPSEMGPTATAHLPVSAELSHVPFFPQEAYQCGPAALATVLHSAGVEAATEALVPAVFLPGRRGSLALELLAATRMRDRLPYPLRSSPHAILEEIAAGHPVLVMQNLGLKSAPVWHFAVVVGYDLDTRSLILRSGTTERLILSERRFMRSWDRARRWAVVVLPPDRLPASPDLDRYITAIASLESVGRFDAAALAYGRAARRWPASHWPVLGLANIDHARGRFDEAADAYRAVLELDPRNVVAHNNLAEILLDKGCLDVARGHADQAARYAAGTSLADAANATKGKVQRAASSGSDAGARRCAR